MSEQGPDDPTIASGASGAGASSPAGGGPLVPGRKLGTRYTVIRQLGRGGMGAVYQAWDEELGVPVAVKVVLREASGDDDTDHDLQQRFKRELLLARQVTHKNVVRIHDMGEVDGLKYITMPFVDGETLGQRLRRMGRLTVAEAISIGRQIVDGLIAAHDVGVVHRDLKPDNVMITPEGHALIMDFGIARSTSGTTQTATGGMVGTLAYMAPEQASGTAVDGRADVYAFGLILRDMLLGAVRLQGRDSPFSELMARVQKPPEPPHAVDATVPAALSEIVTRCTQPAPESRYATTAELATALSELASDGHRRASETGSTQSAEREPAPVSWWRRRSIVLASVGVALALVIITVLTRGTPPASSSAAVPNPVSVLVANFQNQTGDDVFDGVVEQALILGLESASFISTYPRRDALRAANMIKAGSALDDKMAPLVALREGIDLVLTGRLMSQGQAYRISATIFTRENQSAPLRSLEVEAASKTAVLETVGRLAGDIRAALGDPSAQRGVAPGETFTAASLEAARAYAKAQEAQAAGRTDDQEAHLEEALRLDSGMGRAWSGLGAIAYNRGRREEAVAHYKNAMARLDRMTEREKFRTRGGYFLAVGDADQAVQQNEELVKAFPSDGAGFNNLAFSYFQRRDFSRAAEHATRALALTPRHVLRASNAALFALYAGDFAGAEDKARTVLDITPGYPRGLVTRGLSQLALGRVAEAEATYQELSESVNPTAVEFGQYALADLRLYLGRASEAASGVEQALKTSQPAATRARLQILLAQARLAEGRPAQAMTPAKSAVSAAADPSIRFAAARVLARAERPQEALALAKPLVDAVSAESRALGTLIATEAQLAARRGRDALASAQEAQRLADTWLGRLALARAYLALDMFAEAEAELDRCWTRRGEATAVFLDDVPTWRETAVVHYYRGLARAGLGNSAGATEAFKTYLGIKDGGDERADERAEAQRRLAGS